MKSRISILMILICLTNPSLFAQDKRNGDPQTADIYKLVENYSLAREKNDTILLKSILTNDIDQLVSTGEWRYGMQEAVQGMQRSSRGNPGTRTLTVEKVRFLDAKNAIADARYEIKNADGTMRKMWSTFIAVRQNEQWKIAAIRNMLPAAQ
jgi:uncharacterized protein (TIGR02246 family)